MKSLPSLVFLTYLLPRSIFFKYPNQRDTNKLCVTLCKRTDSPAMFVQCSPSSSNKELWSCKDAARHGLSKIQATQEANAAKYFVYIYPLFESFSDINSNKQTNMSRKKYVAGQAVCPLIFNHYATISKDHNKYPMSNAKWCTFCERT